MINYMEYIQRCFYNSTGWNKDNLDENILSTSNNILNFKTPTGFKINVSSKTSEHSYASFQLSQLNHLSSSIGYFYSSINLKNVSSSSAVPLQTMIDGYRLIQSTYDARKNNSLDPKNKRPMLLYAKMYFPSQLLEAMYIKRLTDFSQLTVKCVSTPKTKTKPLGNGIITFIFQRDSGKSSQEYIYSSLENLLGFRCLYNIGQETLNSLRDDVKMGINSSILSLGTEFWYAAGSMSPGVSTSMRYSTHLTSSGKPLTMTVSVNPLLGAISATYAIKTSLDTTFTSKYDFNVYSYDSDLTLGYNLWRSKPEQKKSKATEIDYSNIDLVQFKKDSLPLIRNFVKDPNSFNSLDEEQQLKALDSFMHVKPGRWLGETAARKYINDFHKTNFTSSFMANTSLKEQNLNILWEGKYKDFLVSAGVGIEYRDAVPKVKGYGLELQFFS